MPSGKKTQPLDTHARRELVEDEILSGATEQEIVETHGASIRIIRSDIKAVLADIRAWRSRLSDGHTAIHLRRIDTLIESLWEKAEAGDHDAIDSVIKLMDRQTKLMGLDRPQRFEAAGSWDDILAGDDTPSV